MRRVGQPVRANQYPSASTTSPNGGSTCDQRPAAAGVQLASRSGTTRDQVGALDDERQRQPPGDAHLHVAVDAELAEDPVDRRQDAGPELGRGVRQPGQVLEREPVAEAWWRGSTSSTIRSRHSGRDSPGKPKPERGDQGVVLQQDAVGRPDVRAEVVDAQAYAGRQLAASGASSGSCTTAMA